MKKFEVWVEGYAATGARAKAHMLTKGAQDYSLWEGEDFKAACKNAMETLGWDLSYYDKERNSYWACDFFDNEADARKAFG